MQAHLKCSVCCHHRFSSWCLDIHWCLSTCPHASAGCVFMNTASQTPWNIQCETKVLTATAQADPSVVELSICDFKPWLMDADLAPCSLSVPFSIYQPRDVSWFNPPPSLPTTTLSLPPSLSHFLLAELSGCTLAPVQAIVIFLSSVDAKLRTEQHEQEWDGSRAQQLHRQTRCHT